MALMTLHFHDGAGLALTFVLQVGRRKQNIITSMGIDSRVQPN